MDTRKKEKMPIVKNEFVEYNNEFADGEDLEAVKRAMAANKRVEKSNK